MRTKIMMSRQSEITTNHDINEVKGLANVHFLDLLDEHEGMLDKELYPTTSRCDLTPDLTPRSAFRSKLLEIATGCGNDVMCCYGNRLPLHR